MASLCHCEADSTLNSQLLCHCRGINMAAPLSTRNKEEKRSVTQFLWDEGVPEVENNQRLSAQYGNSALPQCSVYEWVAMFKNGHTSVIHDE